LLDIISTRVTIVLDSMFCQTLTYATKNTVCISE
jgi:hypothetical protein